MSSGEEKSTLVHEARFDTHARLLETIVLVFESDNELVIHAMAARRQYLDLLP